MKPTPLHGFIQFGEDNLTPVMADLLDELFNRSLENHRKGSDGTRPWVWLQLQVCHGAIPQVLVVVSLYLSVEFLQHPIDVFEGR